MTQNLSKTNSHEESVTIQTISDSLEPSIISSMFTIIKKITIMCIITARKLVKVGHKNCRIDYNLSLIHN
jgi:hypothetical protein